MVSHPRLREYIVKTQQKGTHGFNSSPKILNKKRPINQNEIAVHTHHTTVHLPLIVLKAKDSSSPSSGEEVIAKSPRLEIGYPFNVRHKLNVSIYYQ